ncbi:MAG: hypothetical protein IJP33_01515, partial [Firmicutes bacterium]|nr:hypothetical protein [Bacillota bacterium]
MSIKLTFISNISLLAGLMIGMIAQKSRMCFIGGWRDFFLIRDKYLLKGFISFFITATLMFFIFYSADFYLKSYPWFNRPPIKVSALDYKSLGLYYEGTFLITDTSRALDACELKSTPDIIIGKDIPIPGIQIGTFKIPIESILYLISSFIIGLFSTFANGCPMRQHVMAGSGNLSAMMFLLGFYGAILVYDKFFVDYF